MANRNIFKAQPINTVSIDERVDGIASGVFAVATEYPQFIELIPNDLLVTKYVRKLLVDIDPTNAEAQEFVDAVRYRVFRELIHQPTGV
ncbi:hypothetical protein EXU30_19705 [Shewanella maritima]|uniref:Uncharacterized protein n=1 Tax=Shewanella maritima TaxID=2520507 RepID=A0A411PMB8_9GAMM|nr:hypothetical protein [Shewanella maritima]QBF84651.1 hypothetical protein EXU30_19705 [Shewanella maritima]